jgi:hypothetical protein
MNEIELLKQSIINNESELAALRNVYSIPRTPDQQLRIDNLQQSIVIKETRLVKLEAQLPPKASLPELSFSFLHTENLAIYYPNCLDENVVTAVTWLSDLLKQSDFVKTFNLGGHDILNTIISNKFCIRFISPPEYNKEIRSFAHNNSFAGNEYGWYDASIDPSTIFINQELYRLNSSTDVRHLQALAFVTATHELQHFLMYQLKCESPSQPFPSLQPPATEAGDSWEFHNLGGRLGIVSTEENSDFVVDLYLTGLDDDNQEFETLVAPSLIVNMIAGVSVGKNVFPQRQQVIKPVPDSYLKSKILHKCNEEGVDVASRGTLRLNEGFIKLVRKADKKCYVK